MQPIKPTHRHFDLTLQTLTPFHIGTGVELMKDIDFITAKGKKGEDTFRLDVDRILVDHWDERSGTAYPAQLLQSLPQNEWDRYILYMAHGAIRAARVSSKLRECIKTPDYQPYIPGSSLKGALRTALAWAGWEQQIKQPLRSEDIGKRKSWAAQGLEDKIFRPAKERGDGPNKDLMRAIHVSDLHVSDMGKGFQVLNVQVARTRDFASPIEVEAVGSDARFQGRLSVDEYLFSREAETRLHLGGQRVWLTELTQRVNRHSLNLLERLMKRFDSMEQEGAAKIRQFYADLHSAIPQLPADQCVLCLGWGGSWDSKTFGQHLQKNPVLFEQIIRDFKLHRGKVPRKTGDPFPRTRRVIVREHNGEKRLAGAMGWVVLNVSEREARA